MKVLVYYAQIKFSSKVALGPKIDNLYKIQLLDCNLADYLYSKFEPDRTMKTLAFEVNLVQREKVIGGRRVCLWICYNICNCFSKIGQGVSQCRLCPTVWYVWLVLITSSPLCIFLSMSLLLFPSSSREQQLIFPAHYVACSFSWLSTIAESSTLWLLFYFVALSFASSFLRPLVDYF